MSKHTPGPWTPFLQTNGSFDIVVVGATICSRNAWDHRASESIANARLIAAAPDLLDACADMWCEFADTDDPKMRVIADRARAAIAKAIGTGPEQEHRNISDKPFQKALTDE